METTKKTIKNTFELKARGYKAAAEKAVKESGMDATQCTLVDDGDKDEHLFTVYATGQDDKVLGNVRVLQRASRQEPYTVIVTTCVQEVAESVEDVAEPKEMTREEITELVQSLKATQEAMVKALTKYRENIHYIDVESAVREVIAENGADTLGVVLATEAAHYSYDGRMSCANSEWATEYFDESELPADRLNMSLCAGFISNRHHMTILNSAVSEFRKQTAEELEPEVTTVEAEAEVSEPEATELTREPAESQANDTAGKNMEVVYHLIHPMREGAPYVNINTPNDAVCDFFNIDVSDMFDRATHNADTHDAVKTVTHNFMRYRAYASIGESLEGDKAFEMTVTAEDIDGTRKASKRSRKQGTTDSLWSRFESWYFEECADVDSDLIDYDALAIGHSFAHDFSSASRTEITAVVESFVKCYSDDQEVDWERLARKAVHWCAPNLSWDASDKDKMRRIFMIATYETLKERFIGLVDNDTLRSIASKYWFGNIQAACC